MILLLKMFWPKYFSFENHRLQSNWFQHYYMQWEPGSDFIDVPTCFFSFFANFFFFFFYENMDHLFRFLKFFFLWKLQATAELVPTLLHAVRARNLSMCQPVKTRMNAMHSNVILNQPSAKICQDPTIANVVRVFHPTWNADQFWT